MAEGNEESEELQPDIPEFYKERSQYIQYILGVMCFYGFLLLSSMRESMSIAVIGMTNWTYVLGYEHCNFTPGFSRTAKEDGPFEWSPPQLGYLLASYYVGLACSQLMGFYLVRRLNVKIVLPSVTFITSIVNVCIPPISKAMPNTPELIMALQICKGIGHGLIMPCFSYLQSVWVPYRDRARFNALVANGLPVGSFFTAILTAIFCSSLSNGWAVIFYMISAFGILWVIVWSVLIRLAPFNLQNLTVEELEQIVKIHTKQFVHFPTPFKAILSSGPVKAYVFTAFACAWGICFYTTIVPYYLSSILKLDIQMNGLFTAVPFLVGAFTRGVGHLCTVRKLKKNDRNKNTVRKIIISVGLLCYALCLLGLRMIECKRLHSFLLLLIGFGACGTSTTAVMLVPVDLSERFAGFLSSVGNTFGALSGVIIPIIIGYLTRYKQTVDEWALFFYLSIAVSILGAFVFTIFGSCDSQPWNEAPFLEVQEEVLRPRRSSI